MHPNKPVQNGTSREKSFFTPKNLARDLVIEVGGSKIIDLCAGIGSLGDSAVEALIEHGHVANFLVRLPGVIVAANFQSYFGGNAIGKGYDEKQKAL